MDNAKEMETCRLVVVEDVEGVAEDRVGHGIPLCICSIFQDLPGKKGALCEPCRIALGIAGQIEKPANT
jgi:hypothetical protein